MATSNKIIFFKVLREASRNLTIPLAICFTIQIVSNLEIISMALLQFIREKVVEKGQIARSSTELLSYVDYSNIFDQFESLIGTQVIFSVTVAYFLAFFILTIFIIYRVCQQLSINIWVSKTFTFVSLLHSRILFFIFYCFFVRYINLYSKNNSDESSYSLEKAIIYSILLVFNVGIALLKELFCYQIQKGRNASALKDNFHPLILLFHQIIAVPLIYFLDMLPIVVAVFNICFTLINFYVLQTRLPFYNLKMLKVNVVLSTVSLVISALLMIEIVIPSTNVLILMILGIPLCSKLALNQLNNTLADIFRFKTVSSIKIVHLPIILKEHLKGVSNFPVHKRFKKGAFYLFGFLKKNLREMQMLEGDEIVAKVKAEMYQTIINKFQDVLKIYPKNNILLFSMAQIYIKKLGDAPRAINILNRMRASNISIPIENSIDYVYSQLGSMYLKANEKFDESMNYTNYFKYREKTAYLKDKIKKEVSYHLKYWKTINDDKVDALTVMEHAEKINYLSKRIENFWINNFQGQERKYINAPIIYGLYIDLIQGLPYVGMPMVQKAYDWLLTKGQSQKDITDVSAGNSAIIVASIEPEKLGQIIDTSASVKNLFEVEKETIIGSSINLLLPKVIAKKHDRLIQNYHKAFKYDLNRQIISYAKTMGDEYFPVEVTLRVYPSVKRGLNLLAYVKKLSKSESLMTIDYDGRIVDCSKDIRMMLGIHDKADFVSLEKLCPELFQASQAFNSKYEPKEVLQETQGVIDEEISAKFRPRRHRETLTGQLSPQIKHETLKNLFMSERSLFLDEQPLSPLKARESTILIPVTEAEGICESFKEGKKLKFQNSKNGRIFILDTQIEPLELHGDLFKIVKLRSPESFIKVLSNIPESLQDNTDMKQSVKIPNEFPEQKDVPEGPQEQVKQEDNVVRKSFKVNEINKLLHSNTIKLQKQGSTQNDYNKSNEAVQSQAYKVRNLSCQTRTNSIITSSKSGINAAKHLNNLFSTQKISYTTKISIMMVYLAIATVILAVVVDLLFTTKSLQEMRDAVGLIELVNIRSFRTIFAWQGVLGVYARCLDLIDSDDDIINYKRDVRTVSQSMLKSNNILEGRVDDFDDDGITRKFFEKKISLWVPYKNVTLNTDKVDSFTATHILYDYNIYVANYPGPISELKNRSQAISTINNTANDYLLTVEEAIQDVEGFFLKTKDTNIQLLRIIVSFENLALFMPFLSLVVLFKIIISSHTKLFKVISKIQKRSVVDRITQINSIARYLDENVEDLVVFYHDFKVVEHAKISSRSNKSVDGNRSSKRESKREEIKIQVDRIHRRYTTRGIVWNMIKHLIFAFLLISLIIALFFVTFTHSLASFDTLNEINQKTLRTFKLGEQIAMVMPSFYFLNIFQNETKFLIRNQRASIQMPIFMDALASANKDLIASLSTSEVGIDDPILENILKFSACSVVSDEQKNECDRITDGNSFGLLGLNSKYYRMWSLIIEAYEQDPTFSQSPRNFDDLVSELGQIPLILNSIYESMAQHLLSSFRKQVEEKKNISFDLFLVNLSAILFSMIVIRLVILKRYKALDIAIRKVLRAIPFHIIERNKVLTYYLSLEFKKELMDVRGLK